jgi:hypothetical protein
LFRYPDFRRYVLSFYFHHDSLHFPDDILCLVDELQYAFVSIFYCGMIFNISRVSSLLAIIESQVFHLDADVIGVIYTIFEELRFDKNKWKFHLKCSSNPQNSGDSFLVPLYHLDDTIKNSLDVTLSANNCRMDILPDILSFAVMRYRNGVIKSTDADGATILEHHRDIINLENTLEFSASPSLSPSAPALTLPQSTSTSASPLPSPLLSLPPSTSASTSTSSLASKKKYFLHSIIAHKLSSSSSNVTDGAALDSFSCYVREDFSQDDQWLFFDKSQKMNRKTWPDVVNSFSTEGIFAVYFNEEMVDQSPRPADFTAAEKVTFTNESLAWLVLEDIAISSFKGLLNESFRKQSEEEKRFVLATCSRFAENAKPFEVPAKALADVINSSSDLAEMLKSIQTPSTWNVNCTKKLKKTVKGCVENSDRPKAPRGSLTEKVPSVAMVLNTEAGTNEKTVGIPLKCDEGAGHNKFVKTNEVAVNPHDLNDLYGLFSNIDNVLDIVYPSSLFPKRFTYHGTPEHKIFYYVRESFQVLLKKIHSAFTYGELRPTITSLRYTGKAGGGKSYNLAALAVYYHSFYRLQPEKCFNLVYIASCRMLFKNTAKLSESFLDALLLAFPDITDQNIIRGLRVTYSSNNEFFNAVKTGFLQHKQRYTVLFVYDDYNYFHPDIDSNIHASHTDALSSKDAFDNEKLLDTFSEFQFSIHGLSAGTKVLSLNVTGENSEEDIYLDPSLSVLEWQRWIGRSTFIEKLTDHEKDLLSDFTGRVPLFLKAFESFSGSLDNRLQRFIDEKEYGRDIFHKLKQFFEKAVNIDRGNFLNHMIHALSRTIILHIDNRLYDNRFFYEETQEGGGVFLVPLCGYVRYLIQFFLQPSSSEVIMRKKFVIPVG